MTEVTQMARSKKPRTPTGFAYQQGTAVPDKPDKLQSERVSIHAPMSFTGSAERTWKLTERSPKWVWATIAILILTVWWPVILLWYVCFGLLLVPYRLIRRGQRKRHVEELRHRERLDR